MRILHITTFLQGGAGRVIAGLAVEQQRAGNDVLVVADAAGEPGYATYPEYRETLSSAGVAFTELRSTFKRDLALNASAAGQLRQMFDDGAPHVVHAHAAVPAVVARLAGFGGRSTPLVHTMHGWGTAKTIEQALTDLGILQLADAVVTPSSAARRALLDLGLMRPPVQVIPYGIAHEPRTGIDDHDLADLQRLGPAASRILCLGTIGARKNQRLVIDALAQPLLKHVTAVFIGDGDRTRLLDHARTQGVLNRVLALGYRENASRYLAHGAAMVLPSRNEGLPIAVLEAFRAGLPVVASRIPEMIEVLGNGEAGVLFEPDDPAALAVALRDAIGVPDRTALAVSLRQRFESRYSLDRMVDSYERVYRQQVIAPPDAALSNAI